MIVNEMYCSGSICEEPGLDGLALKCLAVIPFFYWDRTLLCDYDQHGRADEHSGNICDHSGSCGVSSRLNSRSILNRYESCSVVMSLC